jgi:multidrug efflux system outer membrane protein
LELINLLTGCTLAPKYTKPEAPVPSSWPSGPAYKEATATPGAPVAADLRWREFFTDERLQKIIETALNNNRDLRVAALTVERARALYRIQRAELLPTVNAVGSGGKERVPADLSYTGSSMSNSLAPILPDGHRDISLNCYTAQLGPLAYLQ